MTRPRFAKGRRKAPGEMNKLEAAYAEHLEQQKALGAVLWYAYEGLTFRLARRTRYTPDFAVMLADGTLEAHEAKGYWASGHSDRVKIKMAAELFPLRFVAVTRLTKKAGGGWKLEEF